jgi:hypothetical protein
MEEHRPVGLRGSLNRLSRALIAYGIVGLVVSAIGLGSTVWVNGRISDARTDGEVTDARFASTIDIAAVLLRGASVTAQSFSGTVDRSAQAVASAAVTTSEVRSDLSALESQLRSVSIFGATPLSSSADAVGRIAASLEGLDTQLPLIADGLEANRDALVRNASALGKLSNSTGELAAGLRPSGQASLDDVQPVIALTLLMFAVWSFVPALGALALGIWLQRELGRSPTA